jgi:uncharacterized membrane protein (UPF0127 family)
MPPGTEPPQAARRGVWNVTLDVPVASTVEHARSFVACARGLLGRDRLERGHALVLWGTASIHMFGMRFAIDVIFLDRDRKVTALYPDRKPNSMPVGAWGARYAVELPAGTIADSLVRTGDCLHWDE